MIDNFDVNATLERLRFADFVVNAWLDKVGEITLDVFLGFKTSDDLKNFVKNKSSYPEYNGRKVIAGK